MAEIHYTRHGSAEQEQRTPEEIAALEALPDEEFNREILAMNMRQGLTERGRQEAEDLGRRLGNAVLPNAQKITAIVGPYRRHIESGEAALSVPELSTRDITIINDPRFAERNRGRLDASIWPKRKIEALPAEHPYAKHAIDKDLHPASWRPPQGESYSDYNSRVDEALAEHGVFDSEHPTVVFGSGEGALARLKLSDDEYRRGTVTEDGKEMPLVTLNNGGIVSLNDAKNPTHWQVHDPEAIPRDQPYQTPPINSSRLNGY